MSEDAKFTLNLIAGVVGFLLFIFAILWLVNSSVNIDEWTQTTNDCYVHTYEDNRLFGNDSGTVITELCPVE